VKPTKSFLLFYIFTIAFFGYITSVNAQRGKQKQHVITSDEAKTINKDAATLFNSGNYDGALKGYQELVATDPNNAEYNYRLGYCYLLTNVDKTKASVYFEASGKMKNSRKETMYFLGLAYMYSERWDDAITSFENYRSSTHSKLIEDFLDVDRQIEMCNNAKELVSHPVNVTFENVGKSVNTPFEDYNPYVSADEKTLVFTSRRKGNMGGLIEEQGIYAADVYYTYWKDSAWIKAKSAGPAINTEMDEEVVGLTADGNTMLVYLDNMNAYSDLAYSTLKGKTWQPLMPFDQPINSKFYETGATITLDGSTIYFTSERKDVIGGTDIFMSKRKENDTWGPAVNLGPVINTTYDEDAPFISMDGKTLYFSSKGHKSMGGFDVFRSTYDETTSSWSEPVNIGYPINNAEDNDFFSMSGDQRHGYISAVRKDGMGDKDIYRITFNDTTDHPFLCVISGTLTSESGTKVEITKATLTDRATNKVLQTYKPSVPDREFVFTAKPGIYTIDVEGYNFKPYREDILVPNEFPLKEITKNIKVIAAKP
jgi:tetratricopeptide (TPR) repeat protein